VLRRSLTGWRSAWVKVSYLIDSENEFVDHLRTEVILSETMRLSLLVVLMRDFGSSRVIALCLVLTVYGWSVTSADATTSQDSTDGKTHGAQRCLLLVKENSKKFTQKHFRSDNKCISYIIYRCGEKTLLAACINTWSSNFITLTLRQSPRQNPRSFSVSCH